MNMKNSDNLLAYFYNTQKTIYSVKEYEEKMDKGTIQYENIRKKIIVEEEIG